MKSHRPFAAVKTNTLAVGGARHVPQIGARQIRVENLVRGIEAEMRGANPHRHAMIERDLHALRAAIQGGLDVAHTTDPVAIRTFNRRVGELLRRFRKQIEGPQLGICVMIGISVRIIGEVVARFIVAMNVALVMAALGFVAGAVLLILRLLVFILLLARLVFRRRFRGAAPLTVQRLRRGGRAALRLRF